MEDRLNARAVDEVAKVIRVSTDSILEWQGGHYVSPQVVTVTDAEKIWTEGYKKGREEAVEMIREIIPQFCQLPYQGKTDENGQPDALDYIKWVQSTRQFGENVANEIIREFQERVG